MSNIRYLFGTRPDALLNTRICTLPNFAQHFFAVRREQWEEILSIYSSFKQNGPMEVHAVLIGSSL